MLHHVCRRQPAEYREIHLGFCGELPQAALRKKASWAIVMGKHTPWLHEQLKFWVVEGLLSPQQAEVLRQRYPKPKVGAPWGVIIFSGLGAVVCGLGVILLLAYNWQDIPKAGKLALIFMSILASHATGLKLFTLEDWRKPLGEAMTLLGTMLYGAGIWLVAQIYHIDEHFPNGFLLWGLGALALAWAMPSVAQGILSVVLLAIWACSEAWGFDRAIHLAPFLILLAVGALSWRMKSLVLLVSTLAGFNFALLVAVGAFESGLVLTVWLNLSAAFVAAGRLCRRFGKFTESEPVWQFFGWLGFLVCLYLFTFAGLLDNVLDWAKTGGKTSHLTVQIYAWAALAVTVLAWLPVLAKRAWWSGDQSPPETSRGEDWLVPLTAILVQVICVSQLYQLEWLVAGPFNLVFLALSVAWMGRGCRQGHVRPTVLGSLMFVALATARYFDLFESLLVRGLVFLVVGAILFAEGILFMRARRHAHDGEAGA